MTNSHTTYGDLTGAVGQWACRRRRIRDLDRLRLGAEMSAFAASTSLLENAVEGQTLPDAQGGLDEGTSGPPGPPPRSGECRTGSWHRFRSFWARRPYGVLNGCNRPDHARASKRFTVNTSENGLLIHRIFIDRWYVRIGHLNMELTSRLVLEPICICWVSVQSLCSSNSYGRPDILSLRELSLTAFYNPSTRKKTLPALRRFQKWTCTSCKDANSVILAKAGMTEL